MARINVRRSIVSKHGRRVDLKLQVNGYIAIPQDCLADLADFCGAVSPAPRSGDMFEQGRAAGRRDVWLRIQAHRHLSPEELFSLIKGEPLVSALDRYTVQE